MYPQRLIKVNIESSMDFLMDSPKEYILEGSKLLAIIGVLSSFFIKIIAIKIEDRYELMRRRNPNL